MIRHFVSAGLIAAWVLPTLAVAQTPPTPPEIPAPKAPPARTGDAPSVNVPTLPRPGNALDDISQNLARGTIPDADAIVAALATLYHPGGLTAEIAAGKARRASSQVEAKVAARQAAEAREDGAKSAYLPAVTLTARYSRLSEIDSPAFGRGSIGPADQSIVPGAGDVVPLPDGTPLVVSGGGSFPQFENQYELKAQVGVPLSDYVWRIAKQVESSKLSTAAAKWEENTALSKASVEAKVAVYDWIRTKGSELVALKLAEVVRMRAKNAEVAWSAKTIQESEVLAARAEILVADARVARAQTNVWMMEEQLRLMQNDPADKKYQIGENVLDRLPPPQVEDEAVLLKYALEHRPELAALGDVNQAVQKQVSALSSAFWPRLDAVVNWVYGNPNQKIFPQEDKFHATWDASLVLTWSPTDHPNVRSKKHELVAKQKELAAQRQQLLDAIRLEVIMSARTVKDTYATYVASTKQNEAARALFERRRKELSVGRGTSADMVSAGNDYVQSLLDVVNSTLAVKIAVAKLEGALGKNTAR